MADPERKVTLTTQYTQSDQERTYSFAGVSSTDFNQVRARAEALNASIAAGTDDGLKNFMIADDYDASDQSDVVGELYRISQAKLEIVEETKIF